MALSNPYYVYGYVKDDSDNGIKGATVTIWKTSDSSVSATTQSGTSGYFFYNLQNLDVSGGDSMSTNATYRGNDSGTYSYSINTSTHGKYLEIIVSITIVAAGDLDIYFGNRTEDERIRCYCSRWDVSDYEVTIETVLSKENADAIKDNTVPGAVEELFVILGKPTFYDTTYDGSNTVKFKPLDELSDLRNTVTAYVKSYGEHIINRN